MPKYLVGPTSLSVLVDHKIGTLMIVTDLRFGIHLNGLNHWINCVLVFDSQNLLAIDQVVRMMIPHIYIYI